MSYKDSVIAPTAKDTPGRLRWGLAAIFFIIGLIAYMDRANISIVAEHMMTDLGMSKVQFGFLGALFSLGYALAQIPSGILAERFGSRLIATISLYVWSAFTILTVVAPTYLWLCIVRFFFGVGEAPLYPSNAVFNTWWFRQNEKARAASFLLAGSYFGPVIAPTLTVFIMISFGWHAVFYIFGVIGILIGLIWYFCARNKPEQHPKISQSEIAFIQSGRTISENGGEDVKAPWRKFMKERPFWAVGFQYFFVAYMTTLFMIWLPTYLQEARGFSLTQMGVAASFPWLAICIAVLTAGSVSDWLLNKGYSQLVARGYIAITGFILFIVGICGAAQTESAVVSVAWLTLALGALGLPVVTSWAIAADKGRQYAGSVSGWMNLWGNLGGVISPILCGWLAQHFGWTVALLFNVIPISLAIICWFFIQPDKPLATAVNQD
ncbi:MFS transporter [Providencia sp. SP181]|uniref:MFS transporter n=1 Tax=Providencia sp. SP181 TaxID=3136277 RepID=UPI003D28CBC1